MERISKSKIQRYALLRHKKYRDKEQLFIAQGRKVVEDTKPYFEIEAIIEDPEAIRKISTLENLPDIIAVYKKPENKTTSLKIDKTRIIQKKEFILVLDGVQDPGNLGTIIRTAHWFGIRKIFCSRNTVDVYNPKVVMSTMGSIAKIEIIYCDLQELFGTNKDIGVYGLDLKGEDLFSLKGPEPGFILMGSEGHGYEVETEQYITKRLTIPPVDPKDHPESLNVAIATAITLSQLLK